MEAECPACGCKQMVHVSAVTQRVRCGNPECNQIFSVGAIPAVPPSPTTVTPQVQVPPPSVIERASFPEQPVVSPPPIPSGRSLVAGYEQGSKPRGPGIKARFMSALTSAKKRAKALKFRHDVSNLEIALEGQQENLGKLAVEHQPSGLDIGPHVAAISSIQQELGQKQATLDSLQQTKGSSSVVKELKKQIADLRRQQRDEMIAIGQQTETVKPDLPDVGGSYSAIAQLRTSLEAKRAELDSLDAELGPMLELDAKSVPIEKLWSWLVIGGGTLVVFLVLYIGFQLFVSPFFAGSLPRWTRDYLVEDAIGVGYANLAEISDSPLVEDFLGGLLGNGDLPADLDVEDFNAAFTVVLPDGNNVLILRLMEDLPLDDLLPSRGNTSSERVTGTSEYRGIEYATIMTSGGASGFGHYFVAKTDANTYCTAGDDDALREVLARFGDRDRETVELDEEIQELVSYVGGEDTYFVSLIEGPLAFAVALADEMEGMPEFGKIDAYGIGLSMNSRSVSCRGMAKFGRERDARRWKEDFHSGIDNFEELIKDAPKSEQAGMKAAIGLAEAVRVKQRDNTAYISGTWSVAEIEDVIEEIR